MVKSIDARGLLCPEPVLKVKKELDRLSQGELEVHVSNVAARDNVMRLARSYGWEVKVAPAGKDFCLTLTK